MKAEAALTKRIIAVTAVGAFVAAGVFAGGTWWAHRVGMGVVSAHGATVYACPMHPAVRMDHPGDCPICGMHLKADSGTSVAASHGLPVGTVQVSADRQEAIGVRLGVVNRAAPTMRLRTTGRVVPDENRTYPVVAGANGWIRKVENVATGDAVKERQELASFVPPQPEFDSAQQSYYTALEMLYRDASLLTGFQPRSQPHDSTRADAGVERMADGLRNLGVSNSQLREMAKGRQLVQDIRIESPVDGFVLKRNVSPGLRFDRGFEFYRIADLNRVWILADVYRDQLPFIRRGASARLSSAEMSRALIATVSASEPVFDETTLTLKVRLETANPSLTLKPGMFVDVEFPVNLPPALVVPADAIVDSGLSKTVFAECGEGRFVPRVVETGWRIGGDVQVTKGLSAGERIVTSGTFLIDSESRMKAAINR